jgi:hypothetical protein
MWLIYYLADLARRYDRLRGFRYAPSGERGAGNDVYPLMWVDDPILSGGVGDPIIQSKFQWTVNIDFLDIPRKTPDILRVQSNMRMACLDMLEKIAVERYNTVLSIMSIDILTLREYNDDNAAGIRATIGFGLVSDVDTCAVDTKWNSDELIWPRELEVFKDLDTHFNYITPKL